MAAPTSCEFRVSFPDERQGGLTVDVGIAPFEERQRLGRSDRAVFLNESIEVAAGGLDGGGHADMISKKLR